MNLSSFSLFPATPEQVTESRKRSHASWSRGATEAEYLQLQLVLDGDENARDGGLVTWVLAPREDPGTLDFRCSCETYKRVGLVSSKADPSQNETQVDEVPCYAIASVFAPPPHRGNGYARHMMRLLHWVFSPLESLPRAFPSEWGPPPERVHGLGNTVFSALWSDVGPEFYRACGPDERNEGGWVVKGAVSTVWKVDRRDTANAKSVGVNDVELKERWTWLDGDQVLGLWTDEVERMKQDLSASGRSPAFSFLPDRGVEAYQRRKMAFYLRERPVTVWGVATATGEAFATWTVDLTPPTLVITRMRVKREEFAEMLGMVIELAAVYELDSVEVWNLDEELKEVAKDLKGSEVEREEHLPAVKWYGEGAVEDVNWRFNEKFCWC